MNFIQNFLISSNVFDMDNDNMEMVLALAHSNDIEVVVEWLA
jgi:hypothetical protein